MLTADTMLKRHGVSPHDSLTHEHTTDTPGAHGGPRRGHVVRACSAGMRIDQTSPAWGLGLRSMSMPFRRNVASLGRWRPQGACVCVKGCPRPSRVASGSAWAVARRRSRPTATPQSGRRDTRQRARTRSSREKVEEPSALCGALGFLCGEQSLGRIVISVTAWIQKQTVPYRAYFSCDFFTCDSRSPCGSP